jgi:hypothetical protein
MKKILIIPITILLALFSMSFAKPDDALNQRAVSSFKTEFNEASSVVWKQYEKFCVATFKMNDKIMYAYYDQQGELIALAHNMLPTGLPESLKKELRKKYSAYWITDCFQLHNDEGMHYFVRIKNAETTQVLTSDGVESWNIYLRQKINPIDF